MFGATLEYVWGMSGIGRDMLFRTLRKLSVSVSELDVIRSATEFEVPRLRLNIRFCKRGHAAHANSLGARHTTNWERTGEQRDTKTQPSIP